MKEKNGEKKTIFVISRKFHTYYSLTLNESARDAVNLDGFSLRIGFP